MIASSSLSSTESITELQLSTKLWKDSFGIIVRSSAIWIVSRKCST